MNYDLLRNGSGYIDYTAYRAMKNYQKGKRNMATLIIEGQLPNLNDYQKACRGNRYVGAKMKKEAEYYIGQIIEKQFKGVYFEGTVRLAFRWYEPNKMRDLDNICFAKKFILDALVKYGVIETDGWKGVIGFTDQFFIDRKSPRIEVEIKEVGEGNGKSRP